MGIAQALSSVAVGPLLTIGRVVGHRYRIGNLVLRQGPTLDVGACQRCGDRARPSQFRERC
jgi:hypothetical protein